MNKILIVFFLTISIFVNFSAYSKDREKVTVRSDMVKMAKEYRDRGYQLQTKGQYKKALSFYQKAISIDPEFTEAYNDAGVVFEALGDSNNAIKMYTKSVQIDDSYLPAHTNLALLYEKLGNLKQAAKHWKKRYLSGKQGDYWWEQAKQRMFEWNIYPEVKQELIEQEAMTLSKRISLKKKRKQEEMLRKNNERARMHYEVALGLFNSQDWSSAVKELDSALGINPIDKELQMQIASFYKVVKKAHAKQLVKHYTNSAIAKIEEEDYFSAWNKLEQASEVISRFSKE